jgi:ClpP class serine protease
MLSSGANKGVGYPGTALTDEQRATLQGQVDYVAALFKSAVLQGRAGDEPSADILDGRCLVGGLAVDANLADGVGDMEAAVSLALTMAANEQGVTQP